MATSKSLSQYTKGYYTYKKKAVTHPHQFGSLARKQALRDYGKAYEFRPEPAAKVCRFIEMLPDLTTGGRIKLFAFQIYIIYEIFAWYHKKTNKRKHTLAYMLIGRKNGKTTLTAAIGLYLAFLSGQRRALVANLATAERQAKILFDTAKVFVKEAPDIFKAELGVKALANEIRRESHNQVFRFYPAKETGSLDGIMPYAVLVDEIASLKNPRLYTVMRSSMGAMDNQLMIAFSSASHNQNIGYDLYQQSEAVINGDMNLPHFLPLIYNLDKDDDIYDERNWVKSTPVLMGRSKLAQTKRDDLRKMAQESMSSVHLRQEYTTKQLGMWLAGSANYFNTDKLNEAIKPLVPHENAQMLCGGLDMSLRDDLTVFAWVWRDSETTYALGYKAWLPIDTVQGSETLKLYAQNGWLTATDGNVISSEEIADWITHFYKETTMEAINYDPAKSFGVIKELSEHDIPATSFTQNCRNYSPPMTELARLIEMGDLHVEKNPMLISNFDACEVFVDMQNNVRPIKRGTGIHNKIDIVVAAAMALAHFIKPDTDANRPLPAITDEQFAKYMDI